MSTNPTVPPPISPPAVAVPTDPVVANLRADAAARVASGIGLILGGIAVSGVIVAVTTALFALVVGLPGIGLSGWFAVFAAVYAGLAMLWLAKRETLAASTAFSYTDPVREWSGLGRYDGAMALVGAAADGLFVGPRMIRGGVDQQAGREPKSRERFFDRCALLLRQLAKAGEAIKVTQVQIGEDETPDKLNPVLNYLDRTGYIGLSSDRSRLWLSSRAKIDLIRMGVPVGPSQPA